MTGALVALVPVAIAGGDPRGDRSPSVSGGASARTKEPSGAGKPDRARPSRPTGLRVRASGSAAVISWDASRDNVGVAGYDVSLGKLRVQVKRPALRVTGVTCGDVIDTRLVAFDRARNRSRAMRGTIEVPGCAATTPGWFGGFESGDLSEWDYVHRAAPERFQVVAADGPVTPRLGARMARVEVRGDEPARWTLGANVSLAEKSRGPAGSGELGADVYWGFSVYLPNDFSYARDHNHNHIAEWHGDNGGQAATHLTIDSVIGKHFGISNPRPGFVADLHLEPFTYTPRMWRLGDLMTGRWVDFAFHIKWDLANGVYEGWMDGVKKFSYKGRTWPSSTSHVKPQVGFYRVRRPETAVLYVDAYKIGTSYEAVAP